MKKTLGVAPGDIFFFFFLRYCTNKHHVSELVFHVLVVITFIRLGANRAIVTHSPFRQLDRVSGFYLSPFVPDNLVLEMGSAVEAWTYVKSLEILLAG